MCILGEGTYGIVYKVLWSNNKIYAVKVVRRKSNWAVEVEPLWMLNAHQWFPKVYDEFTDDSSAYIVMVRI